MKQFDQIKTRNELSDFLKIPRSKLTYLIYKNDPNKLYETFDIPKKNGGIRQISAPVENLKQVQKNLSEALVRYQREVIWREQNIRPNISHGFEKEKSIITNAQIHRNKKYVLNIDLSDFFESFHFGRVRGFFEKNKYFLLPKEVATVIAQLSCYQGALPQGAPCSPVITNLICQILDMRLLKLAKKYRLDYTRYADDLTFSTNNNISLTEDSEFYEALKKEIERAGFKINPNKTRVQYRSSRQEVTGLTVNKKINITKTYYKETRAMAYSLYTTGEFRVLDKRGQINQLEGRFAHIDSIDKYNNLQKLEKKKELNIREREYQKFLVYKHFFDNRKLVIICEGKTDILYIKAALKKMYTRYPSLIEKTKDGFEFKIHFLKRTKRLDYFFNFKEGGSSVINISHFFIDTKDTRHPNYMDFFINCRGHRPKNPVIILLDNELDSKGKKPIRQFIHDFCNIKNTIQKERLELEIKSTNSCHLVENLYLLTNQLSDGKLESEIEDLFDEETLSTKIRGKSFHRKASFTENQNSYGKQIFSEYIYKNYLNINFDNFIPLLDNIVRISESYV